MKGASNQLNRSNVRGRSVAAVLVVGAALSLGGCTNALEGSFNGAAIGSLAGMGIGSLNGNMGEGAAAGAILGGLFGGWQGYQNSLSLGGGGRRRFCD